MITKELAKARYGEVGALAWQLGAHLKCVDERLVEWLARELFRISKSGSPIVHLAHQDAGQFASKLVEQIEPRLRYWAACQCDPAYIALSVVGRQAAEGSYGQGKI